MIRHCRSEEGGWSLKEWEREEKGEKVKESGKIGETTVESGHWIDENRLGGNNWLNKGKNYEHRRKEKKKKKNEEKKKKKKTKKLKKKKHFNHSKQIHYNYKK